MKNISFSYKKEKVLENIHLTVREKEFLSIIGPNGGGKTTLIKLILGLIKPNAGEIFIKPGIRIGYVPQYAKFDRSFPISVYDTIMMGRMNPKIRWFHKNTKEDKKAVKDTIETLGMESLAKKQIGKLSGGQLQKVLMGRALVSDPDVLILDEPTANLDKDNKKEIYELLRSFHTNKTILLITHDVEYLDQNEDRDVVLLNRKIIYKGQHKSSEGKESK